ncbi:MAG TPA: hypothetical protein VD836_16685 [Solirubrobacteraceae bacterium]|nr:hypothetical protein [Solirubrobacteraceae bacterium]
MEYVIPILLVILLVAGFVTFLVMNAAKKGGANAEGDPGPPGIGPDETPLGDTSQHAGEQTREGTTPRGQDDRRFAGRGRPHDTPDDPDEAAHLARPGEGEGSEALDFEGRRPRS